MMKKIVFCALLLILLFTVGAVISDQDGRNAWCNIDDYGCWITNEEDGKTYIMFWSEEARRYIMGTGSAPYKLVVPHPGYTSLLPIECGSPESVKPAVPTATAKPTRALIEEPTNAPADPTPEITDVIVYVNSPTPTPAVTDVIVYVNTPAVTDVIVYVNTPVPTEALTEEPANN